MKETFLKDRLVRIESKLHRSIEESKARNARIDKFMDEWEDFQEEWAAFKKEWDEEGDDYGESDRADSGDATSLPDRVAQ